MPGGRNTIRRNKLASLGLAGQAYLVATAMVCAALTLAPIAYRRSGPMGLAAEAAAAGVCLLGAILALAAGALFRGPDAILQRMGLGMFARTVVPLLLGVGLHYQVPSLATGGMIFYLLAFYVVTLAIETVILVAQVPRSTTSDKSI